MNVAALIAWLVTALGGFYLLGKWLAGAAPASSTAGRAGSRCPSSSGTSCSPRPA